MKPLTTKEHEALLYCVGFVHDQANSFYPTELTEAKKQEAYERAVIASSALGKVAFRGRGCFLGWNPTGEKS